MVEGELDVGVASAWGVVLLWGIVVLSACPVLGWVDGMLISFSRWSPFACCQWWWRVFWRGFVVSFFGGGVGGECGVGWYPQYYGLHNECLVWYCICVGVRFLPLV